MNTLLETLNERRTEGKPFILDGAKGTWHMKHSGLEPGAPSELLLLTDTGQSQIGTLTKQYILSGLDGVQTNSFNLTVPRMGLHIPGITPERITELNRIAVKIAAEESQKIGKNKVFLFGDMGPTGMQMESEGGFATVEEIAAAYEPQIIGLTQDDQVDCLHIETAYSMAEVETAFQVVRKIKPDIPVAVTITMTNQRLSDGEWFTLNGLHPTKLVELAKKLGIQIIGANCGNGFDGMEIFLPQFASAKPSQFVMMKLNAGIPKLQNGKEIYPQASPKNVIAYAKQAFDGGADLIGLCCGGTPELIKTMVNSAKLWR